MAQFKYNAQGRWDMKICQAFIFIYVKIQLMSHTQIHYSYSMCINLMQYKSLFLSVL